MFYLHVFTYLKLTELDKCGRHKNIKVIHKYLCVKNIFEIKMDVVVFHNVKQKYLSRSSITCELRIKENNSVTLNESDCYVGIFHVGWENLSASVSKKSFTIAEVKSNTLYMIEFSDKEIPQADPDEFYQFCFYDIKSDIVHGASCPFQISDIESDSESFVVCGHDNSKSLLFASLDNKKEGNGDNNWIKEVSDIQLRCDYDNDLDSFMVVTKHSPIERDLSIIVDENEKLLKSNKVLIEESERLGSDVKRLTLNSDYQTKLIEEKEQEFKKLSDEFQQRLKDCMTEKEKLEANRAKVNLDNEIMKSELDAKDSQFQNALKQIKSHKEEIIALKNTIYQSSEMQRNLETENVKLKENYQCAAETQGKIETENKEIEKHLESTIEKLKAEKLKTESCMQELEEATSTIDICKFQQSEMEKNFKLKENLYKEQIDGFLKQDEDNKLKINNLNNDLSVTSNDLQQKANKIDELEKDISQYSENLDNTNKKIEELTNKNEELADQLDKCNYDIEEYQKTLEEKSDKITRLSYQMYNKDKENEKTIEELTIKISALESTEAIPVPTSSSDNGALKALQVAYSSLAQKLKDIKSDNEKLKTTQVSNQDVILKENNELKTRLCKAKTSYNKLYNEWTNLKKECEQSKEQPPAGNLQATNGNNVQELEQVISTLKAEAIANKAEIDKLNKQISELNEEKSKLIKHNNEKTSKGSLPPKREQTSPTKIKPRGTDLSPPTSPAKVQQEAKPDIAYPPSMNKIDRDSKKPWLPAVVTDSTGPVSNFAGDRNQQECLQNDYQKSRGIPNRHQMNYQQNQGNHQMNYQQRVENHQSTYQYSQGEMNRGNQQNNYQRNSGNQKMHRQRSRDNAPQSVFMRQKSDGLKSVAEGPSPVASLNLSRRGSSKDNGIFMQEPTQKCPICNLEFPKGFSDMNATAHVNEHFKTIQK